MWNLRGRFDPVTGLKLAAKLDHAVEALFAEATPESCPSDPITKQQHLRALALARLVEGTAGTGRAGRPEFVAVIDVTAGPFTTATDTDTDSAAAHGERGPGAHVGAGTSASVGDGPVVSWPIPIEVPTRILAELVADADVVPVVVRNGVVLHAPGALNLGRTTRLANRAQRRALRALYRTCAIPGCTTGYDRCKLHHIIWWRHGGRTDLDNLLPVCSTTTTRSTTTAGTSPSDPTANSPSPSPTAPSATPDHPTVTPPDRRSRRHTRYTNRLAVPGRKRRSR